MFNASGITAVLVSLVLSLLAAPAYADVKLKGYNGPSFLENATPRNYGSGWDCDRGYKVDGDLCKAVVIPANANLSDTGDRWQCKRGYLKRSNKCLLE